MSGKGATTRQLEKYLKGALIAPQTDEEPRRVPSIAQRLKARQAQDSEVRATPSARPRHRYYSWYDWALVWRYWHGQAQGLRSPCALEIVELLRLGRHLSDVLLGERLGLSDRQIARWRAKFG